MSYEKVTGIVVFSLVVTFIAPVLGVLFGAFAGWVVGFVFEDTIMGILRRLGVNTVGLTMWQLGAALGFFGGYLKTTTFNRDK